MDDGEASSRESLRQEKEKHLQVHQEKQARIRELQAQLRAEVAEDERAILLAKSLANREKSVAPDPEPRAAPSATALRLLRAANRPAICSAVRCTRIP